MPVFEQQFAGMWEEQVGSGLRPCALASHAGQMRKDTVEVYEVYGAQQETMHLQPL